MDLSIIIPSYNTEALLDRCLDSIHKSLAHTPLTYEVIVVDNASTDNSVAMMKKKYPRVRCIKNATNAGYGKANNQGIRQANGTYILLLNSDIVAFPDAIDTLVSFAKTKSNAFIGGKLLNEDKTPQSSCGLMFSLPVVFTMLFLKGDSLGITRYSPTSATIVSWVSGACLLGKKQAFEAVGFFDEHIFMYMEEIDFLYRAKQKKYTVYFYPDAPFIHTGAASSHSRKTPVLNIYRGLLFFYKKHKETWELSVLRILLQIKARVAIRIGRLLKRADIVSIYEEALRLV